MKNLKIANILKKEDHDALNLHPHGIDINWEDNTLYVINHAYAKGGERIDVFNIVTDADDIPIGLDYQYGITSDWLNKQAMGVLNSITVVEKNKFYVT